MTTAISDNAQELVRAAFRRAGIPVVDLKVRAYPDETVFVVYVDSDDFGTAASVGNELDGELAAAGHAAFVTVRKAEQLRGQDKSRLTAGVHDPRATDLTRLLTSRSRTSEAQPSLSYVRDSTANLAAVTAPRHHLIFGRRGVGKTALMLEAKRLLQEDGHLASWINLQTYRREGIQRVFLYIVEGLLETLQVNVPPSFRSSQAAATVSETAEEVTRLLSREASQQEVERLVPKMQRVLRRYLESIGLRLYIFVDDFYYIPRADQAELLDMIHGFVRDCDAWMKIASIQHLTRWFQSSPPLGLQTGQDADVISLDITLQDPNRAKAFLEDVLLRYARKAAIRSLTTVVSREALDRLVFASGGVPRDYLVLSANAITKAQTRTKARLAGVQDVNQAAGDAAQAKLQELEDDLAANIGSAARTLDALKILRRFCLDQKESTYYRVDFRDKEEHADEYAALTSLTELRLNHLVDPSLSDPHHAGERSEVYVLDLSQFSGARLKQGVRVLDFVAGSIVSKKTGEKGSVRMGRTPLQLITILRAAPVIPLMEFATVADR